MMPGKSMTYYLLYFEIKCVLMRYVQVPSWLSYINMVRFDYISKNSLPCDILVRMDHKREPCSSCGVQAEATIFKLSHFGKMCLLMSLARGMV